jgi:PBP1b-binding outer membrane lipoprotein LpoB
MKKYLTLILVALLFSSCALLNSPGRHSYDREFPKEMYRTYYDQNGHIFKVGE